MACNTFYDTQFLQDIVGSGLASGPLSALGELCLGAEYLDMAIKPLSQLILNP